MKDYSGLLPLLPYIIVPAPVGYTFQSSRLAGEGLTKATYNPMLNSSTGSLDWKSLTKK